MELTNYALLVTMLLGFTLIEMGSVRLCNGKYPMYKCLLLLGFGMPVYIGFGLRIQHGGDKATIFPEHKVMRDIKYETILYDFFQMAIATMVAQMGLSGRTTVNAYVVLITMYMAVISPILLYQLQNPDSILADVGGYKDMSRAEMHVFGGFASLAGAIAIGARTGRFANLRNAADQFWAPHDYGAICLGVLLFHVGNSFWYPKNTSGINVANDDKDRSIVNVALGAAAAAASSMALAYNLTGRNNAVYFARGFLAGTIALSASASNVDTIYCLMIGLLSGIYPLLLQRYVERAHIDVPGAVFSVHGVSGAVGMLARGIFDEDTGLVADMNAKGNHGSLSGNMGQIALLALFGMVAGGGSAAFVRYACKGRMSDEQQEVGMDGSLIGMGMAMIKDDAEEEAKELAEAEAKEKAKAEAEANRVAAIAEREARKVAAKQGKESAAEKAAAAAERAAAEADAVEEMVEDFGNPAPTESGASAVALPSPADDTATEVTVVTPKTEAAPAVTPTTETAAQAEELLPQSEKKAESKPKAMEEAAPGNKKAESKPEVMPEAAPLPLSVELSSASSASSSAESSVASLASSEETITLKSSLGPAE